MWNFFNGTEHDGYGIQYYWGQYLDFSRHNFPIELQALAACIAYLWFVLATAT